MFSLLFFGWICRIIGRNTEVDRHFIIVLCILLAIRACCRDVDYQIGFILFLQAPVVRIGIDNNFICSRTGGNTGKTGHTL